jgi:methanogenic corrinoid protein MtbC1
MLDAAVKRLPRFLMDIAPIQRLIGGPGRLRLVADAYAGDHPGRERTLAALGTAQCAELAHAAVRSQAETMTLLRAWHDQGRSWPDIYLQGIGPAACLTGSWWEADRMDFASVSVAVARLQVAVCELSPEFLVNARPVNGAPKRLLQVNPRCQHTLGSLMAAEFFRLGGWAVQVAQSLEPAEWADSIASDWFDVIGLGLAVEAQVPALQAALPRLRSASANPGIKVMLGGPLLQQRPELVRALGADFSASSADEAVALADRWVAVGI